MEIFSPNIFITLLIVFSIGLVHGQDQTGFISLDCGLRKDENYSDYTTNIDYISDESFIDTGVSKTILPQYALNVQRQLTSVRSFPEGTRNCYKVLVKRGTRYLIRATFYYGNYDGLDNNPGFDIHIGVNYWDTVKFSPSGVVIEIIHTPPTGYLSLCLVNTGAGTPFISVLELRPLPNDTYQIPSGALSLFIRADLGSVTNYSYRYPNDPYDRIWLPYFNPQWTVLSTTSTVTPVSDNDYLPPSVIMSSAATPIDGNASMELIIYSSQNTTRYFIFIHFAELIKLQANEFRAFDISLNGRVFYGSFIPTWLGSSTLFSISAVTGAMNYTFSITKLKNSTLPPIINAAEIYIFMDFAQVETHHDDVEAITRIKSTYGVKKNWDGDPCVPLKYRWTGLNCSNDVLDPPRISSLDLSSSGLTGNITYDITKLGMLETLDLSNNKLTGLVPEFLASLPNLKFLNLERNNLTGSVPPELLAKSNNGSLSLRLGENGLDPCAISPCIKQNNNKKKHSNVTIPIAASFGGLVVLGLLVAAVLFGLKKKKKSQGVSLNPNASFETKRRAFSYAEVKKMTNDFDQVLGKGGFGTVFYGFIEEANTPVAVKMLSASSAQGYQEFHAEVKLLMRVHHINLTTLVGYCNEGTNLGLIYEYMAKGNLGSQLSSTSNVSVLTWEGRLQIAIDAASGLEYLHNGCKIVHRDIKTTSILLNEQFQAKLADFGLSRKFPTEGGTHVSTVVAGTPGYLDPEYSQTNRLTEKSDVYSFGVVLLVIITAKPAIITTANNRIHVGQWVNRLISNGDIKSIVDPRLNGDFDTNSVWKAVEISIRCVSPSSSRRPNMIQVVTELSESLSMEQARKNSRRMTDPTNPAGVFSMNTISDINPSVR